ncbi:MAG: molybdopterin guanine dinucleotide synthesis [Shimia sp.]
MKPFDRVIAVDWSARSTPSPKAPTKDAIFICDTGAGGHPTYHRTRHAAMNVVAAALDDALTRNERTVIGFDFGFGYPAGFAKALTGRADPFAVWDWLAERIEDGPDNANNRFEVAAEINRRFPGIGPFWGCPQHLNLSDLPAKGSLRYGHGMRERRAVEDVVRSAQPMWKLYTTGSVGSQSLLGLPHLACLRRRFQRLVRVWPFEEDALYAPVTLTEIYPSSVPIQSAAAMTAKYPGHPYDILDARQVRAVCEAAHDFLQKIGPAGEGISPTAREEGWIAGVPFPGLAAAS